MPRIDSVQYGEIIIDDKPYSQVLIIGDSVEERNYKKLKSFFDTSHRIGDWEKEKLLKDNPKIIIIGTGLEGELKTDEDFIDEVKEKNIELIVSLTPLAVAFYNDEIEKGTKVNALIHTTC